jgi:hypothetical protein
MSSNNHKRSASPSGDRDASLNKRQKREDDTKENQLDEKAREVKEDLTAAALPVNDPDLVVGTVDKDLICSICFCLLTKPTGCSLFVLLQSLFMSDRLCVAFC